MDVILQARVESGRRTRTAVKLNIRDSNENINYVIQCFHSVTQVQ